MLHSAPNISWSVMTHEHKERSADWYWTLGVLALLGAAASVYFSNILLGVILIFGAASIGFLAARGPREHMVHIDERGISLDGTLYPFTSIHSFWIETHTENPLLLMTTSGLLTPHIRVPLDNIEHAEEVQTYLRERAEEVEQTQHFGERLAELLGL